MPTPLRPRRLLVAAATLTALLGAGACQSTEPTDSPEDDALAYLNALAAGDAAAANALTTSGTSDHLPAEDSLAGAEPITDVELGAVAEVGSHVNYVDVPVAYVVGETRHETTIELGRDDDGWLITRGLEHDYIVRWTGFTSQSSANWADLTSVALGSSDVSVTAGQAAVLYPGVYDVAAELGPYAELSTTTVEVAPPSAPSYTESTIDLAVAPSADTLAEVTTALVENLDLELTRYEGERPHLYVGFSSAELIAVWDELLAAESDGATFTASVVDPVEVTWQPEDGIWPVGTATILLGWNGPNGSGEHELTLATEGTWAEATLDELEITPGLWHVLD